MAGRPRQRGRFSKSDGLPFDVIGATLGLFFAGLCLGVPALWFLPQLKPLEVRGQVVQERGYD
ncbi:MAG: hypothetical protein JNJ54_24080 [Myxococcaceae bacterium]|nr:hypothetical protein [Myxococcaceae bacterium]